MLSKRIIPCLDVKDGQVVKGVKFKNHVVLGDVLEMAQRYRDQGADELVFYDITASAEGRSVSPDFVAEVAQVLDIPFCVAGGIRSVKTAREVLHKGADKISINSPAIERPQLIRELSDEFGAQCVVIGIDSCLIDGDYYIWKYTGREDTAKPVAIKTLDWIQQVQELGAGEIVLNCMGADGTKVGYDIEQLSAARKVCDLPLVASGGAGSSQDFLTAFREADVDAALAAGIFHRKELTVPELKAYLKNQNIEVRI